RLTMFSGDWSSDVCSSELVVHDDRALVVRGKDQVAFVVDDLVSVRPWRVRGIEIRGRAETTVLETAQGGHDIIRIHPRTIFSWGLDPAAGHMTKRVVG